MQADKPILQCNHQHIFMMTKADNVLSLEKDLKRLISYFFQRKDWAEEICKNDIKVQLILLELNVTYRQTNQFCNVTINPSLGTKKLILVWSIKKIWKECSTINTWHRLSYKFLWKSHNVITNATWIKFHTQKYKPIMQYKCQNMFRETKATNDLKRSEDSKRMIDNYYIV